MLGDFHLEDVGEVVPVGVHYSGHRGNWDITKKKVIMVIIAPRGSCAIFEPCPDNGYFGGSQVCRSQEEAVRAFVEQHSG